VKRTPEVGVLRAYLTSNAEVRRSTDRGDVRSGPDLGGNCGTAIAAAPVRLAYAFPAEVFSAIRDNCAVLRESRRTEFGASFHQLPSAPRLAAAIVHANADRQPQLPRAYSCFLRTCGRTVVSLHPLRARSRRVVRAATSASAINCAYPLVDGNQKAVSVNSTQQTASNSLCDFNACSARNHPLRSTVGHLWLSHGTSIV